MGHTLICLAVRSMQTWAHSISLMYRLRTLGAWQRTTMTRQWWGWASTASTVNMTTGQTPMGRIPTYYLIVVKSQLRIAYGLLLLRPAWVRESWKAETTFHYCWRVKSSLKRFEWNLPPHSTHRGSAAAHWSGQNLFDNTIRFWPPVCTVVYIEPPLRLRAQLRLEEWKGGKTV